MFGFRFRCKIELRRVLDIPIGFMGLFFNFIFTMISKVPSINFKASDSLDRTPSNQSYNTTLKNYHSEIHRILSEAVTLDERSKAADDQSERDKYRKNAIKKYTEGLRLLDRALALKSDEMLTEKADQLLKSMHRNKQLTLDRLKDFETQERSQQNKLTKCTTKVSNSSKAPATTSNACSRTNGQRNRPQSTPLNGGQLRNKPTSNSAATSKNGLAKNDPVADPGGNKNLSNLSNLKGIDKRIIELILDNIYSPNTKITFDDISGLVTAKQALKEIVVWPMQNPELFTGLREPSRGVLFFGPPGCGKTLLAKSLANESKSTFLSMTASSLTSKWLGESEKLVKALFAVARELKPSILFIDEIDSLLSERKENEAEATRRIKTEFFIELDGLRSESNSDVFVLGATNVPYSLDEAALRRFPKRIFIGLPDLKARKDLLQKLLEQQSNSLSESEINKLAGLTDGYSASDITALAKDAALGPIRELCGNSEGIKNLKPKNVRKINFADFQNSLNKIRRSCVDSSIERLVKWNREYGDISA